MKIKYKIIKFLDNEERITELSEFMGEGLSIDYTDKNNPILHYKAEAPNYDVEAKVGHYIVKIGEGKFTSCPASMIEPLMG